MPTFSETIADTYGDNEHTRLHDKLNDLGNELADEGDPGMVLRRGATANPSFQHITSNAGWDTPHAHVKGAALSGGVLTMDVSTEGAITCVLTQNVTSWSITWPDIDRAAAVELHLHYDGSGQRSITWPSWYTPDGAALPAMGPASGEVLVVALSSFNAGATILAAAQVFA